MDTEGCKGVFNGELCQAGLSRGYRKLQRVAVGEPSIQSLVVDTEGCKGVEWRTRSSRTWSWDTEVCGEVFLLVGEL